MSAAPRIPHFENGIRSKNEHWVERDTGENRGDVDVERGARVTPPQKRGLDDITKSSEHDTESSQFKMHCPIDRYLPSDRVGLDRYDEVHESLSIQEYESADSDAEDCCHRQLSGRCPSCAGIVVGTNTLGDENLHPDERCRGDGREQQPHDWRGQADSHHRRPVIATDLKRSIICWATCARF